MQWRLAILISVGLGAGIAAGAVVEPEAGAILSGATGAIVAASGLRGRWRATVRIAPPATAAALVATSLAVATTGRPVLAAVAMGLMATATSVAAGAGPVPATLGLLGSLAYLLVTALAQLADLSVGISFGEAAVRLTIGCVVGGLVAAMSSLRWRRRGDDAGEPSEPPKTPWMAMGRSVLGFDRYARDGLRRAIPLAIGMYLFQRSGSRDALWLFLGAFVVLLPGSRPPLTVALARVIGTIVAVLALGPLTLVITGSTVSVSGGLAVFLGIAYSQRSPVLSAALTATGAVLIAAAPTGTIAAWGARRLLDTLLGCGLGLGALYLLRPRPAGSRVEPGHGSPPDEEEPRGSGGRRPPASG